MVGLNWQLQCLLCVVMVDAFDYGYYYDTSPLDHEISVTYCGGSGFSIASPLSFARYPLEIPGIQSVYMAVNVSDYTTAKRMAKANVQTIVKKNSWLGKLTVPCIMGFGSCVRPLHDILPAVSDYLDLGQTDVVFHFANRCIPDLPIAALLMGDYDVQIRILDSQTDQMLGCAETKLSVVRGDSIIRCNKTSQRLEDILN